MFYFHDFKLRKWPRGIPEDIGANVVYTTCEPKEFVSYLYGYIGDKLLGYAQKEDFDSTKLECQVSHKIRSEKKPKDFKFEVELFESRIYPPKIIEINEDEDQCHKPDPVKNIYVAKISLLKVTLMHS